MLLLALAGCNAGGDGANKTSPESAAPPPKATLPSIPLSLLEKIFNEATQVDYIFYNYPFTFSKTEKPSIQYSTRAIAEDPAPLLPECRATGRITYLIQGEIALEGDFFFTPGCTYFVFYENQEKKYANYMTDEGIKDLNDQIQQALKLREQAQQGAQ